MRGSDLKVFTDLTLREGDQFVEIAKISICQLTLNPRRDCDIGFGVGSWILLEFAKAKQSVLDLEENNSSGEE
jgi:hypothetical protein